MKSIVDFYNDTAQDWADEWYDNESMLPYLKKLLSYLPNKPRVLDLCCGAGYESMRLSKLGANVVGVDISDKELEIARERNPELEFHNQNILESYKELGKFDGIVCIAGLIHIESKDMELAFANMSEVLNENAYIFLAVKDGDAVKKTANKDGEQYERLVVCYTLEKLKEYSKNYFEFVEELESNDVWKYYIFKKK